MFSLKTTIREEMLEHIWDDKTPKKAWDTFMMLFSKKNDTRLQLWRTSYYQFYNVTRRLLSTSTKSIRSAEGLLN